MDAEAIVIGAGFAGIAAARDLSDGGASVIVLDARDRIGGRTWYREIPGTGAWAEYGGMFFSRRTQPHLAEEIERYGVEVLPADEPAVLAWIRGTTRVEEPDAYGPAQRGLAASRLPDALRAVGEALAAGDRVRLAADDVPIPAWIETIGADEESADYLRAFLAAMGGSRIDRVSMLPLLWDMVELGYDPITAYIDVGELFADGTVSLIDPMAAGLDVRLGHIVESVEHDDTWVTVGLADGRELRASTAVVALPLNCWADVDVTPELAAPKARVAAEGHVGEISKVIAVLEGAPTSFLGTGWDTPINAGFISRTAGEGRQLFMGFSVHDRVDLSDHDAVSAAVRAHVPGATVIATAGHDWVTDPFSKGTWLAIPPGWFGDGTFDRLTEPEGRVAFAGSDIALEGAGWIEGAVASGRAAAARCLAVLAG